METRIEPRSAGSGEAAGLRSGAEVWSRRRPVGRLFAAADATARRHPTALAAALFCGGLATGTWLSRARRARAGERPEPLVGPAPAAPRERPAPPEPVAPRVDPPAGRLTRLRNPVGAPTVMQR